MREGIQLRRLNHSDVDLASQTIRTIKYGESSVEQGSFNPVGMLAWLKHPSNVLIVATENDTGIGFALGYLLDRIDQPRPMLCFYEIQVAEEYRRRGVGSRLVEAMKRVARDTQALKMWVQTSPENVAARTLYQRSGGKESATPDHVYSWPERAFSFMEEADGELPLT